jgi:hypothetical protein
MEHFLIYKNNKNEKSRLWYRFSSFATLDSFTKLGKNNKDNNDKRKSNTVLL